VWQPGQRIGDYELIANLRAGGMATLFLGRRVGAAGFTRDVAIKIVQPHFAQDEQFRQMFLDEAMLSSRIQHPNVVHVEELGEHEGSHFLVMEYVHGCSLSQLQRALFARGRRLSPAFAVRIAMHVADALHAAHETCDETGRKLNVVHRDVSPENVLLAYAGHVKLIDFGIAKAYGRRHRTQDGLLKGKFRYMAPEQAYAREIDRRTDIYQLGILLWELLTLRRLFDAETDVELLQQVREPKIVAPSTLVPGIVPALDAAIMSALDPNPKNRPADAQAFSRMLGKAVSKAHEVDSGALSALVVATMDEHRRREQGTFPPHVYERLERDVQTERLGSDTGPSSPLLRAATLEHTAPYGSDASAAEVKRGSDGPRARRATAQGQGFEGPGDAQVGSRGPPLPRRRRLVRIASEIKTTITRITSGEGANGRVFWLAAIAAIVLGGALAGLTVVFRPRPVPRPPPVPMLAPSVPTQPSVADVKAQAGQGTPNSVLAPLAPGTDANQASDASAQAPALEQGPLPAKAAEPALDHGKLAAPVKVDGTPLVLDPGF